MLYFSAVRPDWNVEKERMARGVSLSENCQEGELERTTVVEFGGMWCCMVVCDGTCCCIVVSGGMWCSMVVCDGVVNCHGVRWSG